MKRGSHLEGATMHRWYQNTSIDRREGSRHRNRQKICRKWAENRKKMGINKEKICRKLAENKQKQTENRQNIDRKINRTKIRKSETMVGAEPFSVRDRCVVNV